MIIHTVEPGESLYSISKKYGIPLKQLMQENNLENLLWLPIGLAVVVNKNEMMYNVKNGDSLYDISNMYGIPINDILDANPAISNPALIREGTIIKLPFRTEKLGSIDVNGYAFPHITNEVLKKTLPFLTYTSIFSYKILPDGNMIPPDDVMLINKARNSDVAPVMVITNIKEDVGFDSAIAHTILTDEDAKNNLISNILNVMKEKNYYSLDVDMEYIYPDDKENYIKFLKELTEIMHTSGYTVTTALAPKLSADQKGILYEAHDYKAIGEIVDKVILMTYEWGYTYLRT